MRLINAAGKLLGIMTTGGDVTKIIAADIGDGTPRIIAGAEDGFVYSVSH